jgi:hypothetical protein
VIDKIGFLVRFWELRARHDAVGAPLSGRERLELLALMQLVVGDFRMPEAGTCARPTNALPAQVIGEGTVLSVELRHVCAAALLVASARSMALGERVIVRTTDALTGIEYTLPCSVAWAFHSTPCIMALVVDGVPARTELAAKPAPRLTGVLSLGPHVRLVS